MITITIEQARELMGADYASVPDSTINMIITLAGAMDECLESSYPDNLDLQEAIKLYAICHMTAVTTGKQTKSQSAPNGASRSFEFIASKEGIQLTSYGRMVQYLDSAGCFEGAFPQGNQFQSGGFGRTCKCY